MIITLTGHTFEIDDSAAAVKEILEQIDLSALKSNSLGILTCSPEFIETGTFSAVSKAMPFDVIGSTAVAGATAGDRGELILTLTVLTSDDVFFTVGLTESLAEEQESPIAAAYRKALEAGPAAGSTESRTSLPDKPAMILAFAPIIPMLDGEYIVECFNKACGGLPIFGSFANDATPAFIHSQTFFNGENHRNAMPFALIYGNINPRFYTVAIPEEKIQKQQGVITKSKDNILMEVNNIPLVEYMQSLGINVGDSWVTNSFPFVVDYNDGTKPTVRSIYTITKEGYAACGGSMPEKALIALGAIDHDDVLNTTGSVLSRIREEKAGSFALMFACLTRYLILGADTTGELEKIREILGNEFKYQFSYSGGEICPVYTGTGSTVNRFHNCSFIACII